MYFIRLDDASIHMNYNNWKKIEKILDYYSIKPIFGIIPANKDTEFLKYEKVDDFWKIVAAWNKKGWIPALHGYSHVLENENGGINPVNRKSEFAGVSLEGQCKKIRDGYAILKEKGIEPEIFFAPAHTFDRNTLEALKRESNIRVISDTIANDIYFANDFYFIPQQSGKVRKLPFKTITFCYHPNVMKEKDFEELEMFLKKNNNKFGSYDKSLLKKRKRNFLDIILKWLYFIRRK